MEACKLYDAEFKFVSLIWEHEPIGSGELVALCQEKLGWKKSTTYTVLRKLCARGVLQNRDSVVTALVARSQVQHYECEALLARAFDNSLPAFLAAFLSGGKKLTREEADELKRMIEEATK